MQNIVDNNSSIKSRLNHISDRVEVKKGSKESQKTDDKAKVAKSKAETTSMDILFFKNALSGSGVNFFSQSNNIADIIMKSGKITIDDSKQKKIVADLLKALRVRNNKILIEENNTATLSSDLPQKYQFSLNLPGFSEINIDYSVSENSGHQIVFSSIGNTHDWLEKNKVLILDGLSQEFQEIVNISVAYGQTNNQIAELNNQQKGDGM